MPDVTVYVPCYNGASFLPDVLPALMSQTQPVTEIILVDDGSADSSAELAEAIHAKYFDLPTHPWPVRVVRHGVNKGLAAARNTGVREARTALVASVDADVKAEPTWLAELVREFEQNPAIAGVGGHLSEGCTATLADRWRDAHMRQSWGDERVERPPFLYGANTCFKRDVLLANPYDERLRTNAEDVKLCEAIRERNLLVYTPRARCIHLRQDSLTSILRTNWRWHYPGSFTPMTLGTTLANTGRHLRRCLAAARKDLAAGRLELLVLDALMPLYAARADWAACLKGERP